MSTQNVERELRAVLERHAEAAMESTDTQAERERFYDAVEVEPRAQGRGLVVAVGVAAAAVTAVAVVSTVRGDDGTAPPPTNNPATEQVEREAELLAERVMAAYVDHDGAVVADLLSSDASERAEQIQETDRNRAWSVEYLPRPCEAMTSNRVGVVVVCRFAMHVFHSEDVGEGPFTGNTFEVHVDDGEVLSAEATHAFERNGMGEYVDEVFTWFEENHPKGFEFIDRDEPDVPPEEWSRYLGLIEQYGQEYADAMTGAGNG